MDREVPLSKEHKQFLIWVVDKLMEERQCGEKFAPFDMGIEIESEITYIREIVNANRYFQTDAPYLNKAREHYYDLYKNLIKEYNGNK